MPNTDGEVILMTSGERYNCNETIVSLSGVGDSLGLVSFLFRNVSVIVKRDWKNLAVRIVVYKIV